MVSSGCFVPGCTSGYVKTNRENKITGKRNQSLFIPPKDEELFEKWKRAIPRKDKILTSKDKICELHFEKECIDTDYVTKLPDGSLHKIPKRHVLKEGSIPTIFSNLPGYLSVKTIKRKSPTPRPPCLSEKKLRGESEETGDLDIPQQSDKFFQSFTKVNKLKVISPCLSEKKLRGESEETGDLDIPQQSDKFFQSFTKVNKLKVISPCLSEKKIVEIEETGDLDIPQQSDKSFQSFTKVNKLKVISPCLSENKLRGESEETGDLDISQTSNEFFQSFTEVKNIPTPNSCWSVACMENYVIFAKWNSEFYAEKRVVVCKDLSTKVFLMKVEVSLSIEECTTETISQLLQKVDDFNICENADSETSGCFGFTESRRRKLCDACYKSKKKEEDAQRKRFARMLVSKEKKIVCRAKNIKNIKRSNRRLEKRILDLKSELMEAKYKFSGKRGSSFRSCC